MEKVVSITYSECNIWNGPIVATRGKSVNQCWGKWLPHLLR